MPLYESNFVQTLRFNKAIICTWLTRTHRADTPRDRARFVRITPVDGLGVIALCNHLGKLCVVFSSKLLLNAHTATIQGLAC